MTPPTDFESIHREVRDYYDARLAAAGPTPAGVDWNSAASQELRFDQLFRLWHPAEQSSVLDYGCGYGALLDYMGDRGLRLTYTGFDISAQMIAEAKRLHPSAPHCAFTSAREELAPADYVVASGIFNVRNNTGDHEWQLYMQDEILHMAVLALRGIAFNVLTLYSDPEKRRGYLYYADPAAWFDFCKRNVGKGVALLHDYPLYEFTLIVMKDR